MSRNERRHRHCCWCKSDMGYTRKDYCSAACKQKHYRYRRRGFQEARPYGVQQKATDGPDPKPPQSAAGGRPLTKEDVDE